MYTINPAPFPGLRIRSQDPTDLPALTDLVAKAFRVDPTWGERPNLTEIAIPASISALPGFDPGLALVAQDPVAGILGYALWYPYRLRLAGRPIKAACLAPLAVDPARFGRGLGSALMEASKGALEAKGISLAFLCGHVGYYPRFGFRKAMFGHVGLYPEALAEVSLPGARLRPPLPGDEAALRRLWEDCLGAVDLALEPDPGFAAWMAWTPNTQALVLELEGRPRAYARFVNAEAVGAFGGGGKPRATGLKLFLAADAEAAGALLTGLGRVDNSPPLLVPLHPESAAARRLFPRGFTPVMERGDYAMILPLASGAEEDQAEVLAYCAGLAGGRRAPGLLLMPSVFDLE